jgi:radical SAM protein with 4Fe4S-binding SPASM domain
MSSITAVISMLHEDGAGSAGRTFRSEPVLQWTLDRLSRASELDGISLLCWEDQFRDVELLAEEYEVAVLAKGPRTTLGMLDAISAARRWADGWRGGLLQTCDFDLGFHGPWIVELFDATESDAILLIDPSAGLVDPQLLDAIISHARSKPEQELCFTQAAPGLGGVVIRRALVDRLVAANSHPGKTLHYLPDQPTRDAISTDACCPIPTIVARSTKNFRLDSDRQIARLTEAFVTLNGQLISSGAEELVRQLSARTEIDPLPREVIIELNTTRLSSPIYRPSMPIDRPQMSKATAARLLDELSIADDIRLTIAGVGDPLESELLFDFLKMADDRGIKAVHIETDLLSEDVTRMHRLAQSPVDVVSFHIPAMSMVTYTAVMGVDLFQRALRNISALAQARYQRGAGVPILVPTFVKCQQNLAEMEIWYDQWTRSIGNAVITGPSDFAGQIADVAIADMAPPRRSACSRLASKLMVLSDGTVVACEQDIQARQPIGRIGEESIERIWVERMQNLRSCHRRGDLSAHPLCSACKEWHRP